MNTKKAIEMRRIFFIIISLCLCMHDQILFLCNAIILRFDKIITKNNAST